MESIGLILFLAQQLGMTLGVGASTFAMVFYIASLRDGTVDASERSFLHITYAVLRVGLFLIITSGVLITAAHVLAGEGDVVFQPAFLAKWILIGIIVMNALLMSFKFMPSAIGGPLAGGSWYALFVLHNIAPETSFVMLAVLYGIWLVAFALLFYGFKMLFAAPTVQKEQRVELSVKEVEAPTLKAYPQRMEVPAKPAQRPITPAYAPHPAPKVETKPHVPQMTPAPTLPKPPLAPLNVQKPISPVAQPPKVAVPLSVTPTQSVPVVRPKPLQPASTPTTPAKPPITTAMPKTVAPAQHVPPMPVKPAGAPLSSTPTVPAPLQTQAGPSPIPTASKPVSNLAHVQGPSLETPKPQTMPNPSPVQKTQVPPNLPTSPDSNVPLT